VPGTRLIGLVVAWCALIPAVVLGQERQQLSIGADAPVTVFADRIENLDRERLLIAEGRVEIEQGDVRLEADRVEVNTETGESVAVGRVVFFDGRDRLTGERLEYNFRTGTGIVYRAEATAEPHFFFKGDRMERFGEKAYRLTGGWFTTCEDDLRDEQHQGLHLPPARLPGALGQPGPDADPHLLREAGPGAGGCLPVRPAGDLARRGGGVRPQ
jgi:lipopolysaccharide assembly outer membrane protein LptD (OstA)